MTLHGLNIRHVDWRVLLVTCQAASLSSVCACAALCMCCTVSLHPDRRTLGFLNFKFELFNFGCSADDINGSNHTHVHREFQAPCVPPCLGSRLLSQ